MFSRSRADSTLSTPAAALLSAPLATTLTVPLTTRPSTTAALEAIRTVDSIASTSALEAIVTDPSCAISATVPLAAVRTAEPASITIAFDARTVMWPLPEVTVEAIVTLPTGASMRMLPLPLATNGPLTRKSPITFVNTRLPPGPIVRLPCGESVTSLKVPLAFNCLTVTVIVSTSTALDSST